MRRLPRRRVENRVVGRTLNLALKAKKNRRTLWETARVADTAVVVVVVLVVAYILLGSESDVESPSSSSTGSRDESPRDDECLFDGSSVPLSIEDKRVVQDISIYPFMGLNHPR